MKNSKLIIDTEKLKDNLREIVNEIPSDCKCVPVLKCDAYGLGMKRITSSLLETGLVDTIAVSHVSEGLELRKYFSGNIWVLSSPLKNQIKKALDNNLILTIARLDLLPYIDKLNKKANVQFKIETGLNRIGIKPGEELDEIIKEYKNCKNIKVIGVFSHFCTNIEKRMDKQYDLYLKAVEQLKENDIDNFIKHIACSSSIEVSAKYCLDAVRIGRRLYMDNPIENTGKIKEVCTYKSYLTGIYKRKKGETLGYSDAYILKKDATIGVIGIGYGDGYYKELFNKHVPVLINGKRAKLLLCCMDQSFVLLDKIDAKVNDEVIFFDGVNLLSQEVAWKIKEEGCSITSNLTNRVERIYK